MLLSAVVVSSGSPNQERAFADTIWNLFLGGSSSMGPVGYGSVKLTVQIRPEKSKL